MNALRLELQAHASQDRKSKQMNEQELLQLKESLSLSKENTEMERERCLILKKDLCRLREQLLLSEESRKLDQRRYVRTIFRPLYLLIYSELVIFIYL